MENELKELFKAYKYKYVEVKDLADYGNEQVHSFILDYDNKADYEKETEKFKELADFIRERCENELSQGDHIVTLEAAFQTNNHFIFIISALK